VTDPAIIEAAARALHNAQAPPMTDIEQVRAALEEIGKLIDLIECSNTDNLALLPLFLEQQKRAAAALTRMEQP